MDALSDDDVLTEVTIDGVTISFSTEDDTAGFGLWNGLHESDSNDDQNRGEKEDEEVLSVQTSRPVHRRLRLNNLSIDGEDVSCAGQRGKVSGVLIGCDCCRVMFTATKFAKHVRGLTASKEPWKSILHVASGKTLDELRTEVLAKRERRKPSEDVSRRSSRKRQKTEKQVIVESESGEEIEKSEEGNSEAGDSDESEDAEMIVKQLLARSLRDKEDYRGATVIPVAVYLDRVEGFSEYIDGFEPPHFAAFGKDGKFQICLAPLYVGVMRYGGFVQCCLNRRWLDVWQLFVCPYQGRATVEGERPNQALRQIYLHYLYHLEVHFGTGKASSFKIMSNAGRNTMIVNSSLFIRGSSINKDELRQCMRCGIWERQPEIPSSAYMLCCMCHYVRKVWTTKNHTSKSKIFTKPLKIGAVIPRTGAQAYNIKNRPLGDNIVSCCKGLQQYLSKEGISLPYKSSKKRRRSKETANSETHETSKPSTKRKSNARSTIEQVDLSNNRMIVERWTPQEVLCEAVRSSYVQLLSDWSQVDEWVQTQLLPYGAGHLVKGLFKDHKISGHAFKLIDVRTMKKEMGLTTGMAVLVKEMRNELFGCDSSSESE